MENIANNLKYEKSPYLLQHADNPVDWYPWGEEAFKKAKEENKPIFLSIGYSTCHWCHVMAHESFEDEEVAKLMNDSFVSIKVDREERPDIDKIYMNVCQMLTRSGGWPLTVIMTPEKKPFFAGTYFPKQSRYGRIGMLELVPKMKVEWENRKGELEESAEKITQSLQNTSKGIPSDKELGESTHKLAFSELNERFDRIYGGFGNRPKFPTPHNLLFLLRYWKRYKSSKALEMVEKTLQMMRLGGIYDHVGYGIHRYSTDQKWLVPHFEKMLYDQAMVALAYIEAYQATKKEEYKKAAEEIFEYVMRDLTSHEGGFYSAEDADSDGKEGKFYLWTEAEVLSVLEEESARLIFKVFNFEKDGNFEGEATRHKMDRNILFLKKPLEELSKELNIPELDLKDKIESARKNLFDWREDRIHPHKDDKILTSWNGLMIAAFAKGAQVFDNNIYSQAAVNAANFLLETLIDSNGRLLHRYRDGEAEILSYLDDYAFLIWGLLELYEATFNVLYLRTALKLNEELMKHFWDEKDGGFYFTADDGEELITRQKDVYDGAIPSGNSVAMLNLLKIARIKSSNEMAKKAEKIARYFADQVNSTPIAYTQLLCAVDFVIGPSKEIVIAGNSQTEDTIEMIRIIRREFIPNKIVILRPAEEESPKIDEFAESFKFQNSIDGKATAYICENYACKSPTTDIKEMRELLNSTL